MKVVAMRIVRLCSWVLCCVLICGCGPRLKVNSVVNPDYSGRKYGKIMVVADGQGAEFQRQMEARVASLLKQKAPELTFVAAHEKVRPPLTGRKLSDLAKTEKLEARLVLVSTRPLYKGADRTAKQIAMGFPGKPEEMLGVEATLINADDHRLWMALISLPAKEGQVADTFDVLAQAVAEKVLLSNILAVE
jgi:hypothetical protein